MKTNPLIAMAFLRQMGAVGVVSEHRFHPERKWRFDYAWPAERVALEVEGGVWINGRHSRGSGKLGDMEKYSAAAVLGWRLLYVTPQKLMTKATADMVLAALRFDYLKRQNHALREAGGLMRAWIGNGEKTITERWDELKP